MQSDWVDDFLAMTPEQQDEFLDIETFSESFWTVTSKSGIVPFKLTPAQVYVMKEYRKQMRERGFVRINILKCRQAGITTLMSRLGMWHAMNNDGVTSLIIAHEQDLPEKWLRKCKKNYEQTPFEFRPEIVINRTKQFVFDNESMFYIGSIQGKFPAMGDTIHFAHFSECGKWDKAPISKDPDAVLGPLLPAIPSGENMSGTIAVYESTGEAVGDWWYKKWESGLRDEDEFVNLFIPWFFCPEYKRDDLADEVGELTAYETAMAVEAEKYGIDLSKSQIAWRRNESNQAIYRADPDRFLAEYPTYVSEAFMSTGGLQYTEEMRTKAYKTVMAPTETKRLFIDGHPRDAQLIDHPDGEIDLWLLPKRGHEYVIGADCMWGDSMENDFDVAYVQDLDTGECCAKIKGQFTQVAWADRLAALGYFYNTAWLAPERNSQAAHGVLPRLLGHHDANMRYPKVWRRGDSSQSKDYGWYTDTRSKGELITFSQGRTLEGEFDWRDKEAVSQMGMIVIDSRNKIGAPKGQNDDCWMARLITAYVAHKIRPNKKKTLDNPERVGLHSMRWFDLQEEQERSRRNRNLSMRQRHGY